MPMPDKDTYRDDLAYIHDAGFGRFAHHAAAFVLEMLQKRRVSSGRVVDLGCGSGILAEKLSQAGYDVLGFDISRAMIAMSRKRVPAARFRHESFLNAELPPCVAVTAVGEIFNYLFDKRNTGAQLRKLFGRVHDALQPRGLFVFDVALIGRVPEGRRRAFTEGHDWACLFEAEEDPRRKTLTRRITSFRKVAEHYRRDHEVHHLRLYDRDWLVSQVRDAGFRARALKGYGEFTFPPGYAGVLAHKP
jgi:SAM-dependent methyltransferase